jgi:hypothetical protein
LPRDAAEVDRHNLVAATAVPERALVLLLCGTEARRSARAGEAAALAAAADPVKLGALLRRQRLTGLVGSRLRGLGADLDPVLADEIASWTRVAAGHGRTNELVSLAILTELEQAGIRALPLKGSVLARELYDDVAARTAGDIDILVAPEDLARTVALLEGMDWRRERPESRATSLPVLHERLHHPTLPRVELHWRVHWYETRFSADALARARPPAPHQPLMMQPADGLAALTLFYERDGFSGLRLAADVAAWWDLKCRGEDAGRLIATVADNYPPLAAPLWVGIEVLGPLLGIPAASRPASLTRRTAAALAEPFFEGPGVQANAAASLVDLLLAPPGGRVAAMRRETQKIPAGLERPLTRHDDMSDHLARWEHALRVLRRWMLMLPPAVLRARRSHSIAQAAADGQSVV